MGSNTKTVFEKGVNNLVKRMNFSEKWELSFQALQGRR
jgi:hypothetical protein